MKYLISYTDNIALYLSNCTFTLVCEFLCSKPIKADIIKVIKNGRKFSFSKTIIPNTIATFIISSEKRNK